MIYEAVQSTCHAIVQVILPSASCTFDLMQGKGGFSMVMEQTRNLSALPLYAAPDHSSLAVAEVHSAATPPQQAAAFLSITLSKISTKIF